MTMLRTGLAGIAVVLSAQAPQPGDVARTVGPCTANQVCSFNDPEDLADVSGTSWLIVSQATDAGDSGLAAFDTATRAIVRYRVEELGPSCLTGARGGGIGIRREGGSYRLVRILHAVRRPAAGTVSGSGDAVESYRITFEDHAPRLTRLGCVAVPPNYFLNDITPLPDGSFAATHMFDPAQPREVREAAFLAGKPTGFVVRWTMAGGWRRLPGSEGTFPNGIDSSPDGQWLAFAETYGHAINRIRPDGSQRMRVPLGMNPDNVTALADGRFVVVGGTGQPIVSTRRCPDLRRPGCGFPAAAAIVDFKRNKVQVIAKSDGASTPGFSVGVVKRDQLYLGTAFGDRLTVLPLKPRDATAP